MQLWQRAWNKSSVSSLHQFCVSVFFMRARFLSTAAFLAALLLSFPSFSASRCDVNVATERVDLDQVSLAYQSIGRASDPALLLGDGPGGQLIHWPDEVVVALCQQGFRVIRYDNRDVGLSTWRQPPRRGQPDLRSVAL